MTEYRIYVSDRTEEIVFGSMILCATDHEACVTAEGFIQPGMFFQVWDGLRRVFQTNSQSATLH